MVLNAGKRILKKIESVENRHYNRNAVVWFERWRAVILAKQRRVQFERCGERREVQPLFDPRAVFRITGRKPADCRG